MHPCNDRGRAAPCHCEVGVAGNTQLLPLTGVTLPLISSGGSSLVSTFFALGMLCGITSLNTEDEARDIEQIEIRQEAML